MKSQSTLDPDYVRFFDEHRDLASHFTTDGESLLFLGEPVAPLSDWEGGGPDFVPPSELLPRGTWRRCFPNLCIHRQFGAVFPILTDGTRSIIRLGPAYEAVHNTNLNGPICPHRMSIDEWDYAKCKPVFPPHLCADPDCPEEQCVTRLLLARLGGWRDEVAGIPRLFWDDFPSDESFALRVEEICKANRERANARRRKTAGPTKAQRIQAFIDSL